MMGELVQDLRFTVRSLAKAPGFASVVILTLALGIGANTTIYSVVDGLVLNPFPFPDGDRLVAVGTQYPKLGASEVGFIEHLTIQWLLTGRPERITPHRDTIFEMVMRAIERPADEDSIELRVKIDRSALVELGPVERS